MTLSSSSGRGEEPSDHDLTGALMEQVRDLKTFTRHIPPTQLRPSSRMAKDQSTEMREQQAEFRSGVDRVFPTVRTAFAFNFSKRNIARERDSRAVRYVRHQCGGRDACTSYSSEVGECHETPDGLLISARSAQAGQLQ